jgi:hypothetical protein
MIDDLPLYSTVNTPEVVPLAETDVKDGSAPAKELARSEVPEHKPSLIETVKEFVVETLTGHHEPGHKSEEGESKPDEEEDDDAEPPRPECVAFRFFFFCAERNLTPRE